MTYEIFKHLKDNNHVIEQAKKSADKYADSVSLRLPIDLKHEELAVKQAGVASGLIVDEILVKSAINTTNIFDSHGDVHIPGLWNKSIKEAKNLLLLQEHQMKFDKVISRAQPGEANPLQGPKRKHAHGLGAGCGFSRPAPEPVRRRGLPRPRGRG